jgi:hypothetical protein
MHPTFEKVEHMSDCGVQVSTQSDAKQLVAEFLPALSASETFAMASSAEPIESDFRVVRRCMIWKS